MRHVMIDLETMGTDSDAAMLAIGAVTFDPESFETGAQYYQNVDLQSCMDVGLSVKADTIMWWLKQSPEARAALSKTEALHVAQALTDFAEWFKTACNGEPIVWSNGAAFDVVILETAMKLCGIDIPWKYFNVRCYRTVKAMYPNKGIERVGGSVAHNALDDALAQAMHLQIINAHRVEGHEGSSETQLQGSADSSRKN